MIRSEPRPPGSPSRAWCSVVILLTLVALGTCGLLVYRSLYSGLALPGCGPVSPCAEVMASGWSSWLGLPVAGPAMIVYVLVLTGVVWIGPTASARVRRLGWFSLIAVAVLLFHVAGWFLGLQWKVLGVWCKYCLLVHLCGVLIAVLVFWRAPIGSRRNAKSGLGSIRYRTACGAASLGLAATVVLVAVQIWSRAPQYRILGYGDVAIRFELYPIIGSHRARQIVLSFFDYTCPHCRWLHGFLDQARRRYGQALSIAVAPVPLDASCNQHFSKTEPMHRDACELARISMAVWRADSNRFEVFDRWLFELDKPRSPAAARWFAAELVGAEDLAQAMEDPWIDSFIDSQIELNRLIGQAALVDGRAVGQVLPKLVVSRNHLIAGRPSDAADLFGVLEKHLDLEPIGP